MSKAFVKDEDTEDDGSDWADQAETSVGPTEKAYITAAGFQKLSLEFDRLWRHERPKVTTEVMWAAAQGDRSENAEYIYGKRRLREIDRRLRFLKKRLDHLVVVTASPEQEGKVFFGAFVTLRDADDDEVIYRLVGSDEIDLGKRWISLDSPVGKALLGKVVGDVVTVQRPKGPAEFTIKAIRYEEAISAPRS